MNTEALKTALCKHFCADILIRETAAGIAVSSGMVLDGGDRIAFLICDVGDSYYFTDDGDFLSTLDASGMDLSADGRRQFLRGTLGAAGAIWDADSFVIRTDLRPSPPEPSDLIAFLASLIRVRDVRFWTRETIRSTFKDDVTAAIRDRFSKVANIEAGKPVDKALQDFPADVVIRPLMTDSVTAVYLVNSNEGLGDALNLWHEARSLKRDEMKVVAVLEDEQNAPINRTKLQRTANRIDGVAFYRGDEDAVIERIGRISGIKQAS
ncbi:DUF1828 domain-containing protein [Azospirillum sp. TSA6c]|uniref:DUF1828 domain-containing protein n=1 Tax=Azospirillum sp. TSA6c TaxID=709813 RepID=UPI000D6485CA|nr:DUF1828 domain-containing protein [Azospirillum sp. TSA6c]